MEIKDGNMYIKRNGKVSGVVKRVYDTAVDFWIPSENFRTYMKNGKTSLTGYNESENDLVELYRGD